MNIKILSLNTVPVSPGTVYAPRKNDVFSLAWVREGGADTRVDGRRYSLQPGSQLLVRPGQILQHQWTGGKASLQSFALFKVRGLGTMPAHRVLPAGSLGLTLWAYLLAPGKKLAGGQILEWMLTLLRENADMPVPPPAGSPLPLPVDHALAWLASTVDRAPHKKPRLKDIASSAGVTPQHLCLLFRKSLQVTPLSCLHALKMEKASGLLESSDDSLSQIADRLGYSSPFHLSATYKKYYGMAPSAYRKAFKSGKRVRPASLLLRNHPLRRYVFDARWNLKP